MINIKHLSVSNDQKSLNVHVETSEGYNITSILLWTQDTFQDVGQSIDLVSYIEGINHKEVFTVNVEDITLTSFEGINFVEFESNDGELTECPSCPNTVLGVATNFSTINNYILNLILKLNVCDDYDNCNKGLKNKIINNTLLIEGVSRALALGYYEEATTLYNKLLKINSDIVNCSSCINLLTPTFNNGLDYAIIDNNLTLI